MTTLSKTKFISGSRCQKMLWLMQHKPEAVEDSSDEHTEEGDEVGALARTYFADAVTVPLGRAPVMAAATKKLIDEGHKTICEATFMQDGLSCSADIVRFEDDGVTIIEVKSSTSVKEVQLQDITFQCYVIESCGYHIKSIYLMHLNGDYALQGELDVHELFKLENVTCQVAYRRDGVKAQMKVLEAVCDEPEEPGTMLGIQCDKPYECPCKAYCFEAAKIPTPSVFDIAGMPAKKKYELYDAGFVTTEQLMRARPHMTQRQYEQVTGMTGDPTDNTATVDKKMVQRFLATVQYPLYLLDFETFQQAVPKFQGAKPYQQIPFQYSLHIMHSPTGEPEHEEFLAEAGKDPRRALAEKLCRDIPMDVQSMAYNFSFEKAVCRALASVYPDLEQHLLNIADNMIDLMIPFQRKYVVTPSMHGSYSIKAVLPALCGGDPDLDYHKLPVVHNGSEAMATFAGLHNVRDPEEVAAIRRGLLLYCGLDTLAMVKVLQKLYELAE